VISTITHSTAEKAERAAMMEALGTIGVVVPIRSIEVRTDSIVLVGSIDSGFIAFSLEPFANRTELLASGIGNLHTSHDMGIVGYLVVRHPLTLKGEGIQWENDEMNVAITTRHRGEREFVVGQRCCQRCNSVIQKERITALPLARFCIECKRILEGESYGKKGAWTSNRIYV
jgi:hypothetical protein